MATSKPASAPARRRIAAGLTATRIANLLKNNRSSKEAREFLEWVGEDFDPERLDRHAANAALLRMTGNQWGER